MGWVVANRNHKINWFVSIGLGDSTLFFNATAITPDVETGADHIKLAWPQWNADISGSQCAEVYPTTPWDCADIFNVLPTLGVPHYLQAGLYGRWNIKHHSISDELFKILLQ